MEECKFKIGDVVAYKKEVEQWATGGSPALYASGISEISETNRGFFISNGRTKGMPMAGVVPAKCAKIHAIKFLAERMAIIAGA